MQSGGRYGLEQFESVSIVRTEDDGRANDRDWKTFAILQRDLLSG